MSPDGGALSGGGEAKWPCAYEAVRNFRIENDTINAMISEVDLEGKSVLDVVEAWITGNESTWRQWAACAQPRAQLTASAPPGTWATCTSTRPPPPLQHVADKPPGSRALIQGQKSSSCSRSSSPGPS